MSRAEGPGAVDGEFLEGRRAPSRRRALLERCQRDDAAARGELYRIHAPLVTKWSRALLGNSALVDDVVQEVFIAAFINLARYVFPSRPGCTASRPTS